MNFDAMPMPGASSEAILPGWDIHDPTEREKAIAKLKQDKQDETRQTYDDFARTFRTPHGRRVLAHLQRAFYDPPTFLWNMNFNDGAAHGFGREGQRSMFAYIENTAKAADRS